ncbi:SPOR domain-containing protein [Steroidobacter agaridevorans]|uniref:SPOR domain-containing protein n=1 Tax=Steroidobacter agaridevorans TaxID=2695856 RepID=UPI00137B57A3|nr:SPOR domain-containing protein [Steroidobacter agaridevorans]
MERPVKERLIGAAVLMAAAIILIPEMLSGPGHDSAGQPAQTASNGEGSGEAAIKTYTIDLNKAPGSQPPTPVEQTDNRAPPPEETPPPETPAQLPAEPAAVAQASPESPAQVTPAPVETPKPAPRETPPPKPEPKPESPKPEPRAVASAPSAPRSAVPTGKGWAVQLASYASEATAERVMNEWRGKGQSAFVMPVTTGGKTLYRVRIGPTKDRASAEAVLKVVKASIPSAAVVAHP